MILFPAIDLIGGKVVRLERGDRSRCKVYSDDPVAVARSFAEQGASWVHVVDLSSAFGEDEDTCAANSAGDKGYLRRRRPVCGRGRRASARSRASTSWPAMVLAVLRWAPCW